MLNQRVPTPGLQRPSGQAAVEFVVVLSTVGLALFVPWQGDASLAEVLRRALSGFMEATLQALALL